MNKEQLEQFTVHANLVNITKDLLLDGISLTYKGKAPSYFYFMNNRRITETQYKNKVSSWFGLPFQTVLTCLYRIDDREVVLKYYNDTLEYIETTYLNADGVLIKDSTQYFELKETK